MIDGADLSVGFRFDRFRDIPAIITFFTNRRTNRAQATLTLDSGFGGTDMDELYVTTAWYGLGEEQRKQQPLAGDLFRAKLDVKGVEEPGFSG
jgi:hypothetical protein